METVTEEEERCICPNCGVKVKPTLDISTNAYFCPECGCTIESVDQNFDTTATCPNCNQLLDGSECPYCGYDLGSDFE